MLQIGEPVKWLSRHKGEFIVAPLGAFFILFHVHLTEPPPCSSNSLQGQIMPLTKNETRSETMRESTIEPGELFCTVECSECPYNLRFHVCGPEHPAEMLDGREL